MIRGLGDAGHGAIGSCTYAREEAAERALGKTSNGTGFFSFCFVYSFSMGCHFWTCRDLYTFGNVGGGFAFRIGLKVHVLV